jgi:hypothetical protein
MGEPHITSSLLFSSSPHFYSPLLYSWQMAGESTDPVVDEDNGSGHDKDNDSDTLKYQLLGPSLTKAGQDAVDQQKVGEKSRYS